MEEQWQGPGANKGGGKWAPLSRPVEAAGVRVEEVGLPRAEGKGGWTGSRGAPNLISILTEVESRVTKRQEQGCVGPRGPHDTIITRTGAWVVRWICWRPASTTHEAHAPELSVENNVIGREQPRWVGRSLQGGQSLVSDVETWL